MLHVFFRLQSAAAEHRIGDAGGSDFLELDSDVVIIVPLKPRIVNDVEEVLLIIGPVFIRKRSRRNGNLFSHVAAANSIVAFQHRHNGDHMVIFHRPQPRRPGIFPRASICNIEYIVQTRFVAALIQQRDALCAAPDITVHFVVPQIIVGTGGGIRPLGIDHHLIHKGVLIQPGRSG